MAGRSPKSLLFGHCVHRLSRMRRHFSQFSGKFPCAKSNSQRRKSLDIDRRVVVKTNRQGSVDDGANGDAPSGSRQLYFDVLVVIRDLDVFYVQAVAVVGLITDELDAAHLMALFIASRPVCLPVAVLIDHIRQFGASRCH